MDRDELLTILDGFLIDVKLSNDKGFLARANDVYVEEGLGTDTIYFGNYSDSHIVLRCNEIKNIRFDDLKSSIEIFTKDCGYTVFFDKGKDYHIVVDSLKELGFIK